jgi:hypothetical protein
MTLQPMAEVAQPLSAPTVKPFMHHPRTRVYTAVHFFRNVMPHTNDTSGGHGGDGCTAPASHLGVAGRHRLARGGGARLGVDGNVILTPPCMLCTENHHQ